MSKGYTSKDRGSTKKNKKEVIIYDGTLGSPLHLPLKEGRARREIE